MKKIYYILPFAFLLLLSGCKENEESKNPSCPHAEVHEHTFSDVYSYDETNHWHKADCEHTEIASSLEEHTFNDQNICTVCGYEKIIIPTPHEHTFETTWSKNESNHWHSATCEHTTLISGLEEHNFGDDDTCDDCGYTKPAPAHEHTFETTWSKNESNHWHAASCEHKTIRSDIEEHDFGDDNICDVCGYEKVVEPAPHVHTFETTWSKSETKHWHAASCEHSDLNSGLADHTFNAQNICTVCGYEKVVEPAPHEHAFEITFTYNETNHWHKASCEHTEYTSGLEEHTFNDQNVCSVCGYERVIEPTKYTITFVDEMNKNSTNILVEEDKTISPIDDPAFEGYTFVGWVDKDNNSFGLKSSNTWNDYKVNSNLTLFASYSANLVHLKVNCDSFLGEFDISIDNDDYISSFNNSVEVGTYVKLKAKAKDYADFNNWSMNDDKLSEDTIYSFIVENKDYNINLNMTGKEYNLVVNEINCKTILNSNKYKAGDRVTITAIPTVAGFVFNGYYDSENNLLSNEKDYEFIMPGHDYQIYAKTFGNKHTITIKSEIEGNAHVMLQFKDDIVIEKYAGEEFILEPIQYTGYRCLGGNVNITMPDDDLEFTFEYEPIIYTISYNNIFGGEYTGNNLASLPKTFTYDGLTLLPPPQMDGSSVTCYTFGWFLDKECTGQEILQVGNGAFAEDLILYAKFEYWTDDHKKDCVVKYVDDAGNEIAPSVNLGRKRFNKIIDGYDLPTVDTDIYTLANNGYGSRMIKTNESQVTLYVRYERKLCNIYYILRHGNDGQKPINYGPIGDGSQILLQYRITSNDDLVLPYFGDMIDGVICFSEGIYTDFECTQRITKVDPTWTDSIQLYIKMVED